MSREYVGVVTGVSPGIGRATAGLPAREGFRVFATVRIDSGADASLANVEVVRLDVRDEESVRSRVRTVLDRARGIDGLVNNAGDALTGAAEETGRQEAVELFETKFLGALRMIRAVLPVMRERGSGRIVNIGSVAGFLPSPCMGIHAASKHALEGYSESSAQRLPAAPRSATAVAKPSARASRGGDDPAPVASAVRPESEVEP